jgi:hypothetical protein
MSAPPAESHDRATFFPNAVLSCTDSMQKFEEDWLQGSHEPLGKTTSACALAVVAMLFARANTKASNVADIRREVIIALP